MNLLEVHLSSANTSAQRRFYAEALALPTAVSPQGHLGVQVGETSLSFEAGAPQSGPYHLAFDVPEHSFSEAHSWLHSRLPLLQEDGQDRFFSEDWNADMLYFTDPEGNILELIARHTLPRPEIHPGTPLLNVSEVGLAVADVPATLQALTDHFGVGAYLSHSDSFTPAGTPQGLLILVAAGRPWFPTRQAAAPLPVRVLARVPRAGQLGLSGGLVQITGVTDS
ncbi:VOC family protein [Deinococcus sp. UYEF24]